MDVPMRMPDLATVDATMTLVRWLVEVGQAVRRGEPLLEVETDKAIVVVESVASGTLRAIAAPAGAEVAAGQVIATIDAEGVPTEAKPETDAGTAPVVDQSGGPFAGAAGITTGVAELATPGPPTAVATTGGGRGSFFARNRQARAGAQPASATPRDASDYDPGFLKDLYRRMVLIREFEEGVKFLFLEGSMPGTIHQCQGQEATAVGVCAALEPGDCLTSTFRGHGHALAKGIPPEELLFELFGAATGCCRGKGGSMHVGDMARGMVPGIAIVGGGIPLAAGMALAFKMRKQRQVVACFFGDGAIAEGAFHEGVNLAAIWDLPVIFACENNLYGASTRVDRVMRNDRIADRAAAYGIRGETVDGNDVLAVYEAARSAVAEARNGQGPVLLELLTYRLTGHSRRDACHYQPRDERAQWQGRDPIERMGRLLLERGLAGPDDLKQIRSQAQARFQAAVEAARCQPMPAVEDLTTHVLA
ncbi:MAG TPA: thiamine pyrophosphate-dependent enzyme [Isosphaeraceae bacterium]|nr:thiamine pyrophosphate-dependent enzyme [Isosphaeraceae bacterium]